ncbi:MAG: lytic transglycosylase domain-containing protein [Porphyrobacter sp.]|nr:lytic transglycosylase domain-containing protein [Porphyrobacter sp.]
MHAAIARASAATGVDFDYLLAQARLESGLDPEARAPSSSAAGLYQFIDGTWLDTVDRHGASHGLGWADAAITRADGRAVVDPALRAEVMALRHDPDAAALMAAELARDNAGALRGVLGREPDATELYLAHFLGADGAGRFLSALAADPAQNAAALFPRAAAANRSIFHAGGSARSVGEVMAVMRGKVAGAINGAPGAGAAAAGSAALWAQPPARSGSPGWISAAADQPAARPSMAETLRATFGAGSGAGPDRLPGAAARRVDAAYARFRSFGL